MESKTSCYYCGKIICTDSYNYTHTMYQVWKVNTFPIGYKFNTRDIVVPRCKSCQTKQVNFSYFLFFPLFIIGFSILFYQCYMNTWKWWWAILFSGVINAIISAFLVYILEAIFFKFLFKIPPPFSIEEYEPAKKLIELGWKLSKPDPAAVSESDIAKDSPFYNESK